MNLNDIWQILLLGAVIFPARLYGVPPIPAMVGEKTTFILIRALFKIRRDLVA